MGHPGVTVLEQDQTDGELRIVVTREVDIDGIPGFAKRFVKPRNTVVSTDRWQDRGDGTYGGEFTLDTKGAPIELRGQHPLRGHRRHRGEGAPGGREARRLLQRDRREATDPGVRPQRHLAGVALTRRSASGP